MARAMNQSFASAGSDIYQMDKSEKTGTIGESEIFYYGLSFSDTWTKENAGGDNVGNYDYFKNPQYKIYCPQKTQLCIVL